MEGKITRFSLVVSDRFGFLSDNSEWTFPLDQGRKFVSLFAAIAASRRERSGEEIIWRKFLVISEFVEAEGMPRDFLVAFYASRLPTSLSSSSSAGAVAANSSAAKGFSLENFGPLTNLPNVVSFPLRRNDQITSGLSRKSGATVPARGNHRFLRAFLHEIVSGELIKIPRRNGGYKFKRVPARGLNC